MFLSDSRRLTPKPEFIALIISIDYKLFRAYFGWTVNNQFHLKEYLVLRCLKNSYSSSQAHSKHTFKGTVHRFFNHFFVIPLNAAPPPRAAAAPPPRAAGTAGTASANGAEAAAPFAASRTAKTRVATKSRRPTVRKRLVPPQPHNKCSL